MNALSGPKLWLAGVRLCRVRVWVSRGVVRAPGSSVCERAVGGWNGDDWNGEDWNGNDDDVPMLCGFFGCTLPNDHRGDHHFPSVPERRARTRQWPRRRHIGGTRLGLASVGAARACLERWVLASSRAHHSHVHLISRGCKVRKARARNINEKRLAIEGMLAPRLRDTGHGCSRGSRYTMSMSERGEIRPG